MKKLFLYSFLTLIILLAILIVLPFIFKDKIQQKVQTELDKTIDATIVLDDFSLNLFKNFPNFTASLSKFGIVGKGEFEQDTLMYFSTLSIELDLGSVLTGKPKIIGINAQNPYFKVKFGLSGKGNFDIMKPSEEPTDTTASEPSSFSMAIEEIGLVGGTFIYDDVPGKMQMYVNEIDGIVSGDVALSVSQLKAMVTAKSVDFIMDDIKFMDAATAEFSSDITVDLDAFKFTFGNNASKLNNMPIRFEGWLAMPYNDIDMDFTFDLYQATFKDLLSMVPAIYATNFEGLKASGNVACNGFIKGTYNDVSIPAVGIDLKVENGEFSYPAMPETVSNVNIAMIAESKGGDASENKLDISKFHFEVAKNPFDFTLNVLTTKTDMWLKTGFKGLIEFAKLKNAIPLEEKFDISGTLNADFFAEGNMSDIEKQQFDKFKAGGFLELANFNYTMESLNQPIQISNSRFEFTPQYLLLKTLAMTVGKSDFNLTGRVSEYLPYVFKDSTVVAEIKYSSKLIDANQLMAMMGDEPATEEAPADTAAMTAFEFPKNIKLTADATVGTLIFDNLNMTDIVGNFTLENGIADLKKVAIKMLDGSLNIAGKYSAQTLQTNAMDFGIGFTNINIPKFFESFETVKKFAPIAQKCTGFFSGNLNISSNFTENLDPDYNSIQGSGKFSSKSIGIKNHAVLQKAADLTKLEALNNPELKDVAVSFVIKDGKLDYEPFDIKLGGTKATVSGSQHFDQSMAHKMVFEIPSNFSNVASLDIFKKILPAGTEMPRLIKAAILITGTLTDPKLNLSYGDGSDSGASVTETAKEAVKEKLKEEFGDDAKKLIEQARQQADKLNAEAQEKATLIRKEADDLGKLGIKEAQEQGQALIKKAGANPIAKLAAEKSAKELEKTAKDKAAKLNAEADSKANLLVKEAKEKGDKLIADAEKKAGV